MLFAVCCICSLHVAGCVLLLVGVLSGVVCCVLGGDDCCVLFVVGCCCLLLGAVCCLLLVVGHAFV